MDKTNIEKMFDEKMDLIMSYLKSDIRHSLSAIPRPFIIEITGSPHSGKTSTIIELDKFLRRHGFRVFHLQESGEAIRNIDRSAPVYNIRTGLYTLTNLLDHAHTHSYDVIIYDRGIFDAYCWMTHWAEKNKKQKNELEIAKKFFLMNLWANMIDRVYFMICSPEQAKKREFNMSISKSEKLDTKNVEMVKLYRNAYDQLSKKFSQIKLIDTTNRKSKEVTEKIALDILDLMSRKTNS